MKRLRALVGIAVCGSMIASAASAQEGGLTAEERRGKQIYRRGTNAAGKEITAYLGNPPMDVPGSLMACANCHGYDGRGRPEGGVIPSDITWQVLTKAYGITHESGRRHPPYTEALIAHAIATLSDPAGNSINPTMPRYELSPRDMSDLIAYMKRLGSDPDPGLTPDTITLGTLIPSRPPLAEVGAVIRTVLSAYFDDINEQGGIYSRKIELRIAECGRTPADTVKGLERFVEDERVFALVGAFIAGADAEIASLLEEREVVLVGPSTLNPKIAYPLNRHTFYLSSGVKEESRALVSFAARTLESGRARAAILYPEDAAIAEIAAAVEDQCRKSGWDKVARIRYVRDRFDTTGLVKELSEGGASVVFFLGSGREVATLAEEAGKVGWRPNILSPGSQAGREILETPKSFGGKVFVSFPMLPSAQAPEATIQFRAFAAKHKLVSGHLAVKFSAYSAATVLVEGLKKAGSDVSREKLITALEGLYKYQTGLTPPITFGPNRRIGALGAHVMELRLGTRDFEPAGGWVEVE